MHLMPPLVRSAARGNPQGLSPRYRKDAPNLARPDCFFSFGFLLFLSRRRAVAVAKAEGGLVLLNPARHHAAQGLSRHSALREGGKSKVTKNAAEAKPDGKTKSPSGGMPEGPKIGTKKNPPPKDGERESISMSDAGEPQEIRLCPDADALPSANKKKPLRHQA